jgi:hypothetical protein
MPLPPDRTPPYGIQYSHGQWQESKHIFLPQLPDFFVPGGERTKGNFVMAYRKSSGKIALFSLASDSHFYYDTVSGELILSSRYDYSPVYELDGVNWKWVDVSNRSYEYSNTAYDISEWLILASTTNIYFKGTTLLAINGGNFPDSNRPFGVSEKDRVMPSFKYYYHFLDLDSLAISMTSDWRNRGLFPFLLDDEDFYPTIDYSYLPDFDPSIPPDPGADPGNGTTPGDSGGGTVGGKSPDDDLDGDGIPNFEDPDIDGDGLLNEEDPAVYDPTNTPPGNSQNNEQNNTQSNSQNVTINNGGNIDDFNAMTGGNLESYDVLSPDSAFSLFEMATGTLALFAHSFALIPTGIWDIVTVGVLAIIALAIFRLVVFVFLRI